MGACRRRPDLGAQGEGGGREEGEKREEVGEVRLLYLSRAGAEQRGGATGASGGEQRRLRRRCCKAEEGACRGCAGSWRAGVRAVPIYRRGMAVARGGHRWPGLAAINGAPASWRAGGGAEKTAELTTRSAAAGLACLGEQGWARRRTGVAACGGWRQCAKVAVHRAGGDCGARRQRRQWASGAGRRDFA